MINLHGYVVAIGPDTNSNYFTGSSYSAHIDNAKVFRSKAGAMSAAAYWQRADHNYRPLPNSFWETRRTQAVRLVPAA